MDRIKIIPENEAVGELKRIYKDIRKQLRLPWVPTVFQAFAPYPDFMRLCWKEIRPLARDRAVEYGAAHLVHRAGERVAAELQPESDIEYLLDRNRRPSLDQVHRHLLAFYLAAPRVLVLMSRIYSWFYEHWPGETQELVKLKSLPYPQQKGEAARPVPYEKASPAVRALFEQIRHDLGLPFTATPYRVLARHMEFLQPGWASLSRVLHTPEYRSIFDELCEIAGAWARELPRTRVTWEKVESLPDLDEYSMRLLSLLVESFYRSFPGAVIHFTFWSQQLHAARARATRSS